MSRRVRNALQREDNTPVAQAILRMTQAQYDQYMDIQRVIIDNEDSLRRIRRKMWIYGISAALCSLSATAILLFDVLHV